MSAKLLKVSLKIHYRCSFSMLSSCYGKDITVMFLLFIVFIPTDSLLFCIQVIIVTIIIIIVIVVGCDHYNSHC